MVVDPDGSLAAFKQLLDHAQGRPEAEAPVTLTEALAGSERAAVLRACAIPHEFTRDILRILGDWGSPDEVDQCYEAFSELSILQLGATALTMHERWRKPLWNWWLRDENRNEFQRISQRLAAHFSGASQSAAGPAAVEALLREYMYHLIGADRDVGFTLFGSLCQRARHQWRFTECSTLIRLVHDYDPILSAEQQAVLGYHEGKLAADLRDWKRAESVFRMVEANPAAPVACRVKAMIRLGRALREQRRVPEAIAVLQQAHASTKRMPDTRELTWRILMELGEAYRDTGRVEDAKATLLSAIEAAQSAEEKADLAGLFNSLGTVYLRQREPVRAIDAFKRSLAELERFGDLFRPAQVQNNLALAYAEQRDWPAAECAYTASIELKRQAGDLLGQGLALQNLSRVQAAQERLDQAVASSAAAAQIFAAQGDNRLAGLARQALSKYARKRRDIAGARTSLEEAICLLERAGDTSAAEAARQELSALEKPIGLPWWVWVLLAVGVAFVIAVIALAVLVEEKEQSVDPPAAPSSIDSGSPPPPERR